MADAIITVLVVEDDETFNYVLSRAFARAGTTVHSARSGGEALALVKAENFEIAVVDLNLGDMSGTAVLETLASKQPHGQVRIAISGADDALAEVRPHVAQAIFRKPIDIEEFVTSLVENARAM